MWIRMCQQQNGFFRMIDSSISKAGLIIPDQSNAIPAGNIARANDCKFAPIDGGVKRDFLDYAAWNLAAHGCAVKHSGQSHVVDVSRCAGDLVSALFARDRLSDDILFDHAKSTSPIKRGNSPGVPLHGLLPLRKTAGCGIPVVPSNMSLLPHPEVSSPCMGIGHNDDRDDLRSPRTQFLGRKLPGRLRTLSQFDLCECRSLRVER